MKPPRSFEENNFLEAIKAEKIKKKPLEELKEVLRLVLVKVGLRAQNWPNDMEKSVLLEHIVSNYGNHTLDEIKLAFDLAMTDRLEVDVNCYENFSCKYFSDIMNAYRSWASSVHKQTVKQIPMPQPKEDLSEIAMKEWWNDTARQANLGKLKMEFIPAALYEWMDKQGGISKTAREKNEYISKAVNHRNGTLVTQYEKSGLEDDRAVLEKFNQMMKQGYLTGDEVDKAKSLAKKMIIWDMMKENS